MASNVGISDLVQGARLAWWIYEHGFNDENAANVRYKNFQNDVLNFAHLLRRLDDALRSASQRYVHRGLGLGARAYDPLSEDFETERKAIVGNFRGTLKDCKDLLDQNKDFRRRHSYVMENLQWHLSAQETRVDELRRRLHMHAQKIRMVCDRLVIDLLTDQDAKLSDLLGLSEQNLNATNDVLWEVQRFRCTLFDHLAGTGSLDAPAPEDMHVAATAVTEKFESQLLVDRPVAIQTGIPLVPGFDALLEHFEQSCDGTDQTPAKYLDLLKTRWLLARIKASRDYQEARPGYYFKRAVNQVEQAVLARVRRPGELIPYDESVLLDLPDICFRIWPSSTPTCTAPIPIPQPLMVRAGEEKVACIDLASDELTETDSINVFQSADNVFRTARETTYPSAPGTKVVAEKEILTDEDRLIPRYALPTLVNPCLEIAIFSRGMETLYRFTSFDDLKAFQSALTGYDVSYDHDGDITCQFSREVSSLDCVGHVQLWQEPILASLGPDGATSPPSEANTRTANLSSQGSHSRHDSLTPSMVAASTINRTAAGWEAEQIKLPAVVIFTQIKDKKRKKDQFAIIFIELGQDIYIDPTKCSCSYKYNNCSKLVLSKPGDGLFTVRAFYSDMEDPNAFDILQFRLPRHPNFRHLLAKKTDFLLLRFRDLEQKRQFHNELNLRIHVRDKQMEDQTRFAQEFLHRVDKPQARQISTAYASPDRRPLSSSPSPRTLQPETPLFPTSSRRTTLSDVRGPTSPPPPRRSDSFGSPHAAAAATRTDSLASTVRTRRSTFTPLPDRASSFADPDSAATERSTSARRETPAHHRDSGRSRLKSIWRQL